ncbi:ABC transporter ATP-binding protein [Rhodococcoides fascians]|uniref:ABC transporter ATP-binding protein n=1 Tax=Rhodococcoides fascians TaxID=1828 RepID=UPI0005625479|nr:ATP-binding cassette domain-containing protein [Rhodococcus fascians]
MSTGAVFEATGLTVRYGGVRANENIDITLEAGTVHGVIGPNGAGKSTFIDALSGRCRLTSGHIRLHGDDITKRSIRWRRKNGVSRSFQRTSVFNSLTVREQVDLVASKNPDPDVDEVLEILSLHDVADQVCSQIAYGTQRSVDLALALIGRPPVLLLDEPCAGLVADESRTMLEHIHTLCRERRIAVLLVEHDVDGIFKTCDRITVLNLGQVIASGEPSAIRKDPAVIAAYLGKEE